MNDQPPFENQNAILNRRVGFQLRSKEECTFGEEVENIGGFVTEQQRWRVSRFGVKGVVNP